MQVILDEFRIHSQIADDLISVHIKSTITCNTCFCSSAKEEKENILSVPASASISEAMNNYLEPTNLTGSNKWFCPQCNCHQENCRETSILTAGAVLILQINRFCNDKGKIHKDQRLIKCLENPSHLLNIRLEGIENVSFSNRYSLVATINHSGSLASGHYWAFIKLKDSGWYSCNDKSVVPVNEKAINNKSVYVLFFERI